MNKKTKKITLMFLSALCFGVGVLTLGGISQKFINFSDPLIEIWFTTFMCLCSFMWLLLWPNDKA
jgi:hypothetical protein